jgi:hypothetical protein
MGQSPFVVDLEGGQAGRAHRRPVEITGQAWWLDEDS